MKSSFITAIVVSVAVMASGCSSTGGSIMDNPLAKSVSGAVTGGANAALRLGEKAIPEHLEMAKNIAHLTAEPTSIDANGNLQVKAVITGIEVVEIEKDSRTFQGLTENYGDMVIASDPLSANNGRIDMAMQVGSALADSVFGGETVEVTKYHLTTDSGYQFKAYQPQNYSTAFVEGQPVLYRSAGPLTSEHQTNQFFIVKR